MDPSGTSRGLVSEDTEGLLRSAVGGGVGGVNGRFTAVLFSEDLVGFIGKAGSPDNSGKI